MSVSLKTVNTLARSKLLLKTFSRLICPAGQTAMQSVKVPPVSTQIFHCVELIARYFAFKLSYNLNQILDESIDTESDKNNARDLFK